VSVVSSKEDLERKIAVVGSPLTRDLCRHFYDEDWDIEVEGARVAAVMSSGYGSGPSVIDLNKLTAVVLKHMESNK
jgi:hypothetical protein